MKIEVPVGWEVTTLGDVAGWGSGGTPSRRNPEFFNGSIPWIKTGELGDKFIRGTEEHISEDAIKKSSAKIFAAGSVGIAMYGATIGKLSIFGIDASTNQACAVAKPLCDLLSNEFLYYYLLSERRALIDSGKGGAQPNISQGILKDWPLSLPPLNEQHRIVAKIETLFSELDKGIESLKTAREQLKVYRQTVLKHAFEGKLTAHWREQNKDKLETPQQLLARIQKERQSRYQRQLKNWQTTVKVWEENDKEGKKPAKPMTPSGIRYPAELELADLPGGWCWVEYAGLCERIRNGISAKPEGDSGTKIFRISAVRAMEFALDDVRYIQNIGGIYDQYLLAQGDLVFTRYNGSRNYVGVCAEYKGDGTHLYPDKLIQTRIGVPSLSSKFLEGAINCGDSRRFIESRIRTTAGQSGISGGDIKSIPIPVCGTEEQEQIALYLSEQTSEIDKMVEEVEAGVRRAETLRQSILKKAFSGQLVPQDANDEPASVLLARIQAENATHAVNSSKTTNKKTGKTSKQGS